ncbi:MAG: carboxypeptidase regulatory-like domain-containing protein [Candidatus Methylomirabilales bacterium]
MDRLRRSRFLLAPAVVLLATLACAQEKEETKTPVKTPQQERAKVAEEVHDSAKSKTESKVATAGATGKITGVVNFAGTPAPRKKIAVTKDRATCGQEKRSKALIVGANRGVRYAVVSLAGIRGTPKKPAQNSQLDQRGCEFRPHVLIVPAGSTLDILNSDGILHNFHTTSAKNPTINRAQPGFRKIMNVKFDQPEIVKVTCDAHSWMQGWIVVAEHPYYAVTDDTGSFTLANVPAGSYQIKVWHETLGEATKDVVVRAGEETPISFDVTK